MHFVFLGTSGAVPSASRDTTWLAFVVAQGTVLVDCGGSPVQKLRRAGIDPLSVSHLVVTHLHPDHAYGVPALVQNLHLLGRATPLDLHCRPEHVDSLEQLLALFRLRDRPGIFPIRVRPVDLAVGARALVLGPLAVSTAPNEHGRMPNFALRVDLDDRPGAAVVYSSDTAPSQAVVDLARGADTLIHEATFPDRERGRFGVHSTAAEAGEVAARAGVRRLILTHVEADYHDELDGLVAEAAARFGGVVEVARELEPYEL